MLHLCPGTQFFFEANNIVVEVEFIFVVFVLNKHTVLKLNKYTSSKLNVHECTSVECA